jgi:hypothetical protein
MLNGKSLIHFVQKELSSRHRSAPIRPNILQPQFSFGRRLYGSNAIEDAQHAEKHLIDSFPQNALKSGAIIS